MDKIKIHELAKKLEKSSKEIMEVASKLGIEIKSHLSLIEADDANKIEKEITKVKPESQNKEKQKQEKSNSTPVIIRREVI
ncbi:MAG: translation initiation factor IF-2 N-terminal domain-containing protein, partial [Clostridia bacterium]|nr:translation initiation factor IF-2 N-terminal domain-containing protein [Clostridia bacterium]